MASFSLSKIAQILHIPGSSSTTISHFAIDSRKVVKGDLFFALPGAKADGHLFLKEVAERGALAAVVSKHYSGPAYGLELLKVEHVKEALQQLAKDAFGKRKEKVIAITGSMGKTTTKEFLATLLSGKYRVAKTEGNQNTQLTMPLTLLNLEGEYDFLILEMGMSQRGNIAKLVEIAPPDMAILTRIAPAGMEDFRGGLNAIADAKAEIFSSARTHVGIISIQAASFQQILYAGIARKWIYGWKESFVDPRSGDFVMEKTQGGVRIEDSPVLKLPIDAQHLQENFLAAAVAARMMGLSWEEIQERADHLKAVERRFEKIEKNGVTFIQDSYNANPDSLTAALKNLPQPKKGGKVIGVLGSMVDLGESSAQYHQQMGTFASGYLDQLLCLGKEGKIFAAAFSDQGKRAEYFSDLAAIKKKLYDLIQPGDVVLIKGSNSLKLWELLDD